MFLSVIAAFRKTQTFLTIRDHRTSILFNTMQAVQFLHPAVNPYIVPAPKKFVEYEIQKYAKLKDYSIIMQSKVVQYNYDQEGNQKIVKRDNSQKNVNSLLNLEKGAMGQYNGFMSPATRRKVRCIIENFLLAIQMNSSGKWDGTFPCKEVYPTLLTLTLPGMQYPNDLVIKQLLGRFMEWITGDKKKGYSGFGVKNYLWVAESQANGNIHFHIILDRAVDWKPVQKVWNWTLEKVGALTAYRNRTRNTYVDIYNYPNTKFFVRKDMLLSQVEKVRLYCQNTKTKFHRDDAINNEKKRQLEAYNRNVADNWNNPPTVDIKKIRNVKKLGAYISKYMTKNPEMNPVNLGPGEKLVEENGNYFIESETVTESLSISGEPCKTYHTSKRRIVRTFTRRKIQGKLWQASEALHEDFVKPMEIQVEKMAMEKTISYTVHKQKYQVALYETDIFGGQDYKGMVTKYRPLFISDEKRYSVCEDIPYNADYIRFLKEVYVSKKDIERATACAGEQFQRFGGIIIPLESRQMDVLGLYFPVLRARYQEYYEQMFKLLYPDKLAA